MFCFGFLGITGTDYEGGRCDARSETKLQVFDLLSQSDFEEIMLLRHHLESLTTEQNKSLARLAKFAVQMTDAGVDAPAFYELMNILHHFAPTLASLRTFHKLTKEAKNDIFKLQIRMPKVIPPILELFTDTFREYL